MTTALHTTWNSLTGQCLNEQAVARLWFDFEKAGFTLADLVSVLKFMLYHNATIQDQRYRYQFRVLHVVGDLEWFASMLASVQATRRNRVTRTARDVVLAQSGRPAMTRTDTAKPIREALLKAIQGL